MYHVSGHAFMEEYPISHRRCIFTARIRSLREGNVSGLLVCLSVVGSTYHWSHWNPSPIGCLNLFTWDWTRTLETPPCHLDQFKLVHFGREFLPNQPSPLPTKHAFSPFIYWQAGSWPLSKILSCRLSHLGSQTSVPVCRTTSKRLIDAYGGSDVTGHSRSVEKTPLPCRTSASPADNKIAPASTKASSMLRSPTSKYTLRVSTPINKRFFNPQITCKGDFIQSVNLSVSLSVYLPALFPYIWTLGNPPRPVQIYSLENPNPLPIGKQAAGLLLKTFFLGRSMFVLVAIAAANCMKQSFVLIITVWQALAVYRGRSTFRVLVISSTGSIPSWTPSKIYPSTWTVTEGTFKTRVSTTLRG